MEYITENSVLIRALSYFNATLVELNKKPLTQAVRVEDKYLSIFKRHLV